MTWKILAGSVAGTSHLQRGAACQDYGHAVEIDGTLIAAVADGAGSAARSATGAKLAVLAFVRTAAAMVRDRAMRLKDCFAAARRAVVMEACVAGVALREYACTLLGAVIGEEARFGQIGDGAMVFDGWRVAHWPQSGEYANSTNFLTGAAWEEDYVEIGVDDRIGSVALFTDGLQGLALRYAERVAHGPFFDPLFRALQEGDEDELAEPLRSFLDSRAVNERTDDDKTLILATRR